MLVDSHCHLDFPDFAGEIEAVVARARDAGVGVLVTISTRLSTFDRVLAVAERFENVFCSVGVHPHEAGREEGAADTGRLLALAQHPKVIGIGETGLDYYYEHSPREAQAVAFRAHIAAARVSGLPLIVHSRDADHDTAEILAAEMEQGTFPGLMHCFSSSRQLADAAINMGLHISLSGIVTFKSAEPLRDTVRSLPLDRLLIETDAPYLAPVPMRGKRNEPAYIAHTAAAVAKLKGIGTDDLARATTANFFALFGKAASPAAGAPEPPACA